MDITDILKTAIESEQTERAKYMELAKQAEDPETRAVLEQLARDEEEHARKLKERLAALRLMRDLHDR